ncbi:hypothetical protein KUTeg_020424 [Tegillarca granosa]|uniref:Prokineticin domain-containing protein n=1 Tax=Tegillarca granosa TaxID=220873 RepID=A0ABQ9ECZ5_TEGGR|nr:hypothetical protein KUTeg_020424 [Tegillarca granosa]
MSKIVNIQKCISFIALIQIADGSTIPPASGSGVDGSSCAHQSDCGTGLCCVHSFLGTKKRFVFENGFGGFFNHGGLCHPYRMINESCMPFMTHDIFNHELYEHHCPCEKGLECRGETVDEGPHSISHTNPKCQSPEKK